MLSALVSLLVLGWLVIVHEFGHFLVARWSGVRVLRFSIGFGPRLLTWQRGHTEYALSAIPLGGYVKMAGEQRGERPPPELAGEPWEYLSKPIGTRAAIVFAGPFVNYLVALASLWAVFVIGYPELLPVVGKVVEDLPAQAAGVQVGDRIQAIDGHAVQTWEQMTTLISAAPNQPLAFRVERGGEVLTLAITPQPRAVVDPLGRRKTMGLVGIAPSGAFESHRVGPVEAFGRMIEQHNEWIAQTVAGLWSLVTGKLSVRDSVTGPIGIVFLTSEAVRIGLSPLLFLISLFSLNLAIFNLFPIPILDGGHLFFLAVERWRGRPVSLTVQERSAQVSLALLVTLILIICVNDLSRFGVVDKLVQWIPR